MPFEPPIERLQRLQRCDGALTLGLARDAGGVTRIEDLYQHDPCRVLFPSPEPDDIFQAVILTTSGGLAGGDRIAATLVAGPGTRAQVTTQAAEKIYRSRGENTEFTADIAVGAGAWLEWLPQETILFEGARFRRETRIDLAADARLLAAEMVVFGRTARGERITYGHFVDRWRISRAGRPVWADTLTSTDDPEAALAHSAGFGGAIAVATVVHAGREAGRHLEAARAALAAAKRASTTRSAVTVVNEVLIARFLGNDAQELRSYVAQVWCILRNAAGNLPQRLPRTWYT